MHEPSARYWRQFFIWLAWVIACYVFWRWLASYILPFVLAIVLAALVEPLVVRLQHWGLGRLGAVLGALGGVMASLILVCGAILTLVTAEMVQISHRMPDYLRAQPLGAVRLLERWNRLKGRLGLGQATISGELHSAYQMLAVVLKSIGHALVVLPELALMMVVAAVAAFFILRDDRQVLAAVKRASPPAIAGRMGRLTTAMTGGLWGYMRAELALVSLTGLVTTGGLLLIGAPYAALVGLMAGLLDMVPFMGPTVLLVPWAAGAAATGHWPMAVHLLMVLAAVAVIRQLIEPRLVGQGTGLHPLVVLFSLYIGIRLFGGGGVIIGPVSAVMLNAVRQVMREGS